MYCPGKEFTEPCVFLILKSKSNVCQSLESPIGELSEWAGHAGSFSSIFLQRCSPIAHKQKSGLNWRRSVRFPWADDEWNLFRLAEIVLAIIALLKAKAIDERFNFHGYGVKLIARWPNPREFHIRETWTSQNILAPVVSMNLFEKRVTDAFADGKNAKCCDSNKGGWWVQDCIWLCLFYWWGLQKQSQIPIYVFLSSALSYIFRWVHGKTLVDGASTISLCCILNDELLNVWVPTLEIT